MRYTLFIVVACLLIGCGKWEEAHDLALSLSIRGKGEIGSCGTYAVNLLDAYQQRGIEAKMISYRWETRFPEGAAFNHAIVAYRTSDGEYWAIDNMMRQPKRLPKNATDLEVAWLVTPNADTIKLLFNQTEIPLRVF